MTQVIGDRFSWGLAFFESSLNNIWTFLYTSTIFSVELCRSKVYEKFMEPRILYSSTAVTQRGGGASRLDALVMWPLQSCPTNQPPELLFSLFLSRSLSLHMLQTLTPTYGIRFFSRWALEPLNFSLVHNTQRYRTVCRRQRPFYKNCHNTLRLVHSKCYVGNRCWRGKGYFFKIFIT